MKSISHILYKKITGDKKLLDDMFINLEYFKFKRKQTSDGMLHFKGTPSLERIKGRRENLRKCDEHIKLFEDMIIAFKIKSEQNEEIF